MKIQNAKIYNSRGPLDIIGKYNFKGLVLYKFAKIKSVIRDQCELLDLVKNQLIRKYGMAGEIKPGTPTYQFFVDEWTEVLKTEVDIDIPLIKLSELNLNDNEFPSDELSKVIWLIEEDA